MIFEKGDFIQNRYHVDTILYSHKEEIVYLCKYRQGFKLVKQIFPDKEIPDRDKLFTDRCNILKKLNHKNLLQIDDFFIEDSSYFVVMERMQGKSLEEIQKEDYRSKPFPSDILMQYMIKVCDGLKYMHSQNPPVLFGYISPETVIAGRGGLVKLINYGLIDIVKNGFNAGVAGYAPPEQSSGKKETHLSDVYSVAALMYYLLSGKFYEPGTKKIETLMNYNPLVSKNLAELIAKPLSRKSANRPDITDFSRQLSKLYLSETVLKATRVFPVVEPEDEKPEEVEDISLDMEDVEKVKPVELEEEEIKISLQNTHIETISTDVAEEEGSEKKEKKKKKKKKKKIATSELSEEVSEETEEIRKEAVQEEKEEIEYEPEDVTGRDEESEKAEESIEERALKEKKKKKKKKKKHDYVSEITEESYEEPGRIDSGSEEETSEKESETDEEPGGIDVDLNEEISEIDTLSEVSEKSEKEHAEKKDSKSPGKTSMFSQQLLSVIKQKEYEEVKEDEYDKEDVEVEEEVKIEEKEESVKEIKEESSVLTKKLTEGTDKKITRKSSIADFLRSKTGLSEEEYEVNRELVTKGRRKSGLSEEFLASLKATSSSSVKFSGDTTIKEVAFPFYKKPLTEPPLGVYEEVDMLKNNRYEIRELIHSDCYGAVYRIQDYDEKDDEKSIKILKEIQYKGNSKEKTASIVNRFQQVMGKLITLKHTGLTEIEDYFHITGENGTELRLCIIMEYIEGMSFSEVAMTYYGEDGKSQMPAKTVLGVISKVYDALGYLHSNSVVYGDLRPSNLLLASDGNIKFLNYGIADIFRDINDDVYPCRGTYGYVAPELKSLSEGDFKSDIFSLGAVMYFMLTGNNPEEISYKFQPLRKLNPFLSPQIERFVQSMLSPSNRPDISQIIRVMDNMNFFEAVKDKVPGRTDTVQLKAPDKDPYKESPGAAGLEQLKSNISEISETIKKVPPQLLLIAFAIVFAVVFMVVWTVGYIQSRGSFSDFLYVFSSETKELVALDRKSGKVCRQLQLGDCRSSMAFSATRKELYVLNTMGKIFIINLPEFVVKKFIALDNTPYAITMLKDEKTLCVTTPASSELALYSIEERKKLAGFVVGKFPTDVLLLEKENMLLVTDFKENKVYGMNLRDNKLVLNIDTGQGPKNMLYIPDRDIVYITNWISNDITVIHIPNSKLAYTIPVGTNPSSIAASPDYKNVYVANQKANSFSVIDVDTHKVTNEIKVDGEPTVIMADSKNIYVGLKKAGNNKVVLLNRTTFGLEKDFSLAGFPINLLLLK